jgi:hydroxyacylglutathione hydrolase
MLVEKLCNSILQSNSYILHDDEFPEVYIIDPGDIDPLANWIEDNKKKVRAIFVTHYHIDHIYGINELQKQWPSVLVYVSEMSLMGLMSPKMNGSYYMSDPYVVEAKNIEIISSESKIILFGGGIELEVIETPGHNDDCISFKVSKYLFTGDALIPGNKVHTRSKNANKPDALRSIISILENFGPETTVCPGHGDITLLRQITLASIT